MRIGSLVLLTVMVACGGTEVTSPDDEGSGTGTDGTSSGGTS